MDNKNKNIDNEKEELLRAVIRESLPLYSQHKKMLREQSEKEEILRSAIRELLISEAKASKQPPPSSTLEGILNIWLKNVIGNVKIKFLNLQDGIEEQEGFITTFLNGISELFMFPEMDKEKEEAKLEEEEKNNFKLKYGAFDDLDPEEEKSDDTEEKADSTQDDEPASDLMGRGKRFAYKELQALTSSVQDILKDIIPQERENARQTILKNFGAWMDYWSMNNDQVSTIIEKTLKELGVAIEQDELPSEEQPIEEPLEEPVEQPLEEPAVPDEAEEEPALEEEIDFDFE